MRGGDTPVAAEDSEGSQGRAPGTATAGTGGTVCTGNELLTSCSRAAKECEQVQIYRVCLRLSESV